MSKSIIGNKYNRLTVLETTDKRGGNQEIIYKCRCDCGNYHYTTSALLKNGGVQSCGCLGLESSIKIGKKARKRNEKHYKNGTFLLALDFEKPKENNTSGCTGVSWHKKYKNWCSYITLKGKKYYLGQFNKIEDAIKVREIAEEILFKPILDGETPKEWDPKELRDIIYQKLRD